MSAGERLRVARQLSVQRLLYRSVLSAVVLLSPPVTYAEQHTAGVPIEGQAGSNAAEEQNLFGSRIADVGKLFERLFGLGVRFLQDAIQVALELRESDAGNLTPAENAGLGAHSAHRRQREQNLFVGFPDGFRGEADLSSEAFEDRGAALVGQEIAGILPEDEFEGPVRGRQFGIAVMTLEARNQVLEFGHADLLYVFAAEDGGGGASPRRNGGRGGSAE